jgi:hypothetical protein
MNSAALDYGEYGLAAANAILLPIAAPASLWPIPTT